MNLNVPKEPKDIKESIQKIESVTGSGSNPINWDSFNVWYGNKLPKHLWDEWKDELKPAGFTWQKFLKLLGRRTDAVLLWYKGAYTWEQFIRETVELIKGPLGEEMARRK